MSEDEQALFVEALAVAGWQALRALDPYEVAIPPWKDAVRGDQYRMRDDASRVMKGSTPFYFSEHREVRDAMETMEQALRAAIA